MRVLHCGEREKREEEAALHGVFKYFEVRGKKPFFWVGIFAFFLACFLSLFRTPLGIPLASGDFQERDVWKILLLFSLVLWGGTWGFFRKSLKKEREKNALLQERKKHLRKIYNEGEAFRERFAALFHGADLGILFLSFRGIVRDCNSRAAEILGFPEKKLLFSQFLDVADSAPLEEAFSRALELGMGEFHGELQRDGGKKSRYVRCRFLQIDPQYPEKGLCCIIEDLTWEYRMRRELEESEDFLNMIINFLPVGLLFVDENTNIICRANEYILHRLGRGKEFFSECPYSQIIQRATLSEKELPMLDSPSSRAECLLKGEAGELLPMLRNYVYVRYRDQVLRLESFIDIGERKKAEEALRKNREALAEANALAHLGSFEMNPFSREIFASEELYHMLGFTAGGIQGLEDILGFVYPGDREKARNLFGRMEAEWSEGNLRKEYSQELRLRRPYKGMGWFVFRARMSLGEGEARRIFVTMQEITELRLMEKAVRESEKKYRGIFESLQDVYFKCNCGGFLVEISPSVKKLGEYDPEELVGLGIDVFFQDDAQRKSLVARLFRDGYVSDFELSLKARGGEIRHVSVNSHLLRDSEGAIQAYEGMIRDVTERKKQEEQRRILSEVIHQSPLSIAVCSRDGEILYVNAFFQNRTGLSQEVMQGKSLYAYLEDYTLLDAEVVLHIGEMLQSGTSWNGEVRRHSPAGARGEDLVDSVRLLPLRDPSGRELLGIAFMGEDVTAQKRMQKALVEAREAAESASSSKSIFLANMSHEIRTPMNAILGYSQLLQREKGFSAKQKEFLDIIGRSGEHLLALINDILEMSKIEAGRITLHREPGNLHMLLRDLERMFRIRSEEKGLSLVFDMGEDVPEWIFADHDKIRQVFMNLLSNALKFTQRGSITVRMRRREDSGEHSGMFLVAEVEDTGCGIAPEELERVFSSFEQTSSGIRHGGGTGLGMTISRQYARLMGGDIAVESEPDRGSLFRFGFEYSSALPVEEEGHRKKLLGFDFQGREIRILVVDDSPTNRDVLVQMLEQAGFLTAQAEGGTQGVELFESWNPHLILMDYRMADMDGYEATDRIRQIPGGHAVPIIMVTASVLEEKRKEALDRGINGFLRKPFRREDLFEEILKNLALNGVYEEFPKEPSEGNISRQDLLSGAMGAELSGEMRRSLVEATEIGDEMRLRELLEIVTEKHGTLGEQLLRMVDNFDYESILRVLREEEEKA